jgi:hypothetical protein
LLRCSTSTSGCSIMCQAQGAMSAHCTVRNVLLAAHLQHVDRSVVFANIDRSSRCERLGSGISSTAVRVLSAPASTGELDGRPCPSWVGRASGRQWPCGAMCGGRPGKFSMKETLAETGIVLAVPLLTFAHDACTRSHLATTRNAPFSLSSCSNGPTLPRLTSDGSFEKIRASGCHTCK